MNIKFLSFSFYLCILQVSSQLLINSSKNSPKPLQQSSSSFKNIRQQFKPYFQQVNKFVKANVLSEDDGQHKTSGQTGANQAQKTPMTISSLQMMLRNELKRKVNICYRRFMECSKQLSAAFCASSTKNITFYLWARNVAEDIMNGHGDDDERFAYVKCSPGLLKKFFINKL